MSGSKRHIASRNAHVTLHQTGGQRHQEMLQIQHQLQDVKTRIEKAQARNTALSAWVVKWASALPQDAIKEWNRILEEYQ